MKQIEMYIESNKKWLQELIDKFEETNSSDMKKVLNEMIIKVESYIKGLEDAKKYIEEESKEV